MLLWTHRFYQQVKMLSNCLVILGAVGVTGLLYLGHSIRETELIPPIWLLILRNSWVNRVFKSLDAQPGFEPATFR